MDGARPAPPFAVRVVSNAAARLTRMTPEMSSLDGLSQGGEGDVPSGNGQGLSLDDAAALVDTQRPGRFLFEKRLGNGGMGTVFLVYDSEFEIHVAIKLVYGDPRARREGCATAGLRDLRIVTVRDMFQCGAYLAIVMEYVDGITLDAAFDTGALARDYPTLLQVAWEVSGALACLHGANVPVLHRDLKGANVLITRTGAIRLLDFGLGVTRGRESRAPQSLRTPRSSMSPKLTWGSAGTPTTMAPEQAFAPGEVGPYSDVFSFGAMLFYFATGAPPHDGATPDEVLRLKRSPAPSLAKVRPNLPPEFCALIDGCLTIDWRKRVPHDGVELHAAIDALCALDEPVAGPTSEMRTRTVPPAPPAPIRLVTAPTAETQGSLGKRRGRKTGMLVAAAVALLAFTATAAVRLHSGQTVNALASSPQVGSRVEGAAVATPARVAVLGFTSAGKDAKLEADAARAAEQVAAALELDGPLVLHAGDAGRGDIGKKLAAARASKDPAARAALAATGVQYALVGDVSRDDSRVDARIDLVDMKSGATVASVDAHGPEARFGEIMDRLGDSARALLSMPPLDADARSAVHRVLPEDAEAAREYVRALTLLDRGELRAARGKLVAIGAAGAKSHARTQVLVAEIDRQLGDEAEAKTYAERARGLVGELPERERLPIEARGELASGNAQVAVAKLKALAHRTVEDTLRLAEAADSATRYEDGLAALGELEAFGDAFARDAHILQLRASLAWNKSDTEETLRYAREAGARAGERIAVRAHAKRFEAKALYLRGGASAEANAALEEAMSLLLAIDDTRDAASLHLTSGDAKYDAMDFPGAIEQYRAALQIKGVSPSTSDTLRARIMTTEWKLGHSAEAERIFSSLVAKANVNDFARGYAYLYAAAGAREQGHLGEASSRLAKAREALDKMPGDRVLVLLEESALERARGHARAALALAKRAFQLASTDAKDFTVMAANAMGWAYLADRQGTEAGKMFALAYEGAHRLNWRIDEDEACKGLAKSPLQDGERLIRCRRGR